MEDNTQDMFNILSKLLEEVNNEGEESSSRSDVFNDLCLTIDNKYMPIIEKIQYKNKYNNVEKIKGKLNIINLYMKYPELINKTVIGFFMPYSNLYNSIFNKFLKKQYLDEKKSKFKGLVNLLSGKSEAKTELLKSLITIISNGNSSEKINALTLTDNITNLTGEEYIYMNDFSKKNKFSLNNIIYLLGLKSNIINSNQALIIIPKKVVGGTKYYKSVAELIDVLVIDAKTIENNIDNFTRNINLYTNVKDIILVGDTKKYQQIEKIITDKNIKLYVCKNNTNLYKYLEDNYNNSRNNFYYKEIINKYLNEVKVFLSSEIYELNSKVQDINNDLMTQNDQVKKEIKKLQKITADKINSYSKMLCDYESVCKEISKKIEDIQNSYNIKENSSNYNTHINTEELFLELLIQEIQIGKVCRTEMQIKNIRKYAEMYNNISGKNFVTNVLLNDYLSEALTNSDIVNFVNWTSNNELVIREKIRMRKTLRIDDTYCGKLLSNINCELNGEEHYLLGEYYKKNGFKDKALNEFNEAIKLGNKDAGRILIFISDNLTEEELQYFADQLIPEANYMLGCKYYNKWNYNTNLQHDYLKCIKYLKIAAALSNCGAIKLLGDISYNKAIDCIDNKNDFNIYAKDALNYYKDSIKIMGNDSEINEKIGILDFELEDYSEAKKNFQICNTPEGNYRLGLMYQNSLGQATDRNKALSYFEKAAKSGHSQAQVECDKINSEILAEQQKNTYQEGASYSSSSYYSGYYSSYYNSGW